MNSKKSFSVLLCCILAASAFTGVTAADNDGWTQADQTEAAQNGAWDAWVQEWDTEKTDWENISLTPGKDETELNFAWYSKADAGVPQFKFYEKEAGETADSLISVAQTAAVPDYNSNKVTVTGLESGKTYCYSYTKDGAWTEVREITPKDSSSGYSFMFFGDPQIGSSDENIPEGGTEEQGQDNAVRNDSFNWNNTINSALELKPDIAFMVSAGDQIQSRDSHTADETHETYTDNEIEYAGYLSPKALETMPVATTIGNHDALSSNYTYHFNNPNSSELGSTYAGGDYYFTYGNTLFIMLNTNNTNAAEHKQLIEQACEENTDAKWRIVTLHQDIYGSGEHSNEPEIVELRYSLTPILEGNDIDVVLTGHDHTYSRSYIMKNAEISKYDWDMNSISDDEYEAFADGVIEDENGDEIEFVPTEEQQAKYDNYLAMIEDKDYVNSADSEIVENPDGILYLTANSASGSKYYDLVEHPQAYIAARWQEDVPTFSTIDVTDDELTINTYRTDTMEQIDKTFTIRKTDEPVTEYTVTNASFKNGAGETLDAIPESGSFIAELSVKKTGEGNGNDYIAVAAYDESGALVGLNYCYADVPADTDCTFGIKLDVPENGTIASVKAYVWDDFGTMTPLAFDAEL